MTGAVHRNKQQGLDSSVDSAKRIRGTTLQRIRARHFSHHPLCVHCEAKGIVRLATELDHIIALTNGGTETEANRAGLCKSCHADKTRRDLGQKAKPAYGLDGFPIDETR